jgi:dienelactone hydrolase
MSPLDTWAPGTHTGDSLSGRSLTFPTYRKGEGPGVIVIHEIPGLTPTVIGFAEEVVEAGFTVVLPHLFGRPGAGLNPLTMGNSLRQVCVSREFTKLATRETSPIAGWLRSLARDLHAELGGAGVGALGMCFTGGFALAMMVDDAVAAPVLCQPSVPFAVGRRRGADLNLSPADLEKVKGRAGVARSWGSSTTRTPPPAPASTPSPARSARRSSGSSSQAANTPRSPCTGSRRASTGCWPSSRRSWAVDLRSSGGSWPRVRARGCRCGR